MRIHELIEDDKQRKLYEKFYTVSPAASNERPVAKPARPIKSKSMSRREIEELMGVRRDTYKRVNGKVKRK